MSLRLASKTCCRKCRRLFDYTHPFPTGRTPSTGSTRSIRARWSSSTRSATSARSRFRAPSSPGCRARTCPSSPRTASELVISIDIADFAGRDRLASRCGLAPRNRRSGTSIPSVSASRQGNKRLKNLLVFSGNCLSRSRNRWGEYYARCRDRGIPHGKALKAVARKRLEVIYAIMGGARFHTQPNGRRRSQARQGLRQHCQKRPSKGRIPLDRTTGTPPPTRAGGRAGAASA